MTPYLCVSICSQIDRRWNGSLQLTPSTLETDPMFPAPKACAGLARKSMIAMVRIVVDALKVGIVTVVVVSIQ
jgi:hypothetical protein